MSQYEIRWQPMLAWTLFLVMFPGLFFLVVVLDSSEDQPPEPDNRWDAAAAVEATDEARIAERWATEEAEQHREFQKDK